MIRETKIVPNVPQSQFFHNAGRFLVTIGPPKGAFNGFVLNTLLFCYYLLLSTKHDNIPAKCPAGFHPGKNKPSGDVPGRQLCQRESRVINSASPLIFKFLYITVFLLFLGGKWSKFFSGENFQVHRVTWPGCSF